MEGEEVSASFTDLVRDGHIFVVFNLEAVKIEFSHICYDTLVLDLHGFDKLLSFCTYTCLFRIVKLRCISINAKKG